jgi:hypothetical protein
MKRTTILASFARPEELLAGVRGLRERHCDILDVYTPYPVHGLEEILGWPRSRLAVACFLGGAAGAGLALWFQFWTSAWSWPLNVGGRPWNSLPAFVPVVFECMVLLAGFALFFAWLFRCQLYPGKTALLPLAGATDDRFVVAARVPAPGGADGVLTQWLRDCHAITLEERAEEELP